MHLQKLKSLFNYFTKGEIALWCISTVLIVLSFFIFDRENYLTLVASLIGITSLIFNAKGNPLGQFLIIIFSILYGIISFKFNYYGEMVTYLGMTAPMAVVALISWLRNPYNGNKVQVKVHQMHKKEAVWAILLTAMVTAVFYFILEAFHTANLLPSTISVATSFLAAYLTFRRSPYFALAYAANYLVLIWLWILAAITDISYLSVIVCFILFFANDLYGFYSWKRMQIQQNQSASEKH